MNSPKPKKIANKRASILMRTNTLFSNNMFKSNMKGVQKPVGSNKSSAKGIKLPPSVKKESASTPISIKESTVKLEDQ